MSSTEEQVRASFTVAAQDEIHDQYVTAEGASIGVRMPGAVIRGLAWAVENRTLPAQRILAEPARREWVARLRTATSPVEVSVEDGHLAKHCATPEDLSRMELLLTGGSEANESAWVARVRLAGWICELSACSVLAAIVVAEGLGAPWDRVRDAAASSTGRAIRPGINTPAMNMLRDGAKRALADYGMAGWPRYGYSWAGILGLVDPLEARRRCREELSLAKEDDRLWLITAMAKYRNTEMIQLLRGHLHSEDSPRVALRILVEVGAGVAQKRRLIVLRDALSDASPWWRWQAIQELWRLEPRHARPLAADALLTEPDPILTDLLSRAISSMDRPAVSTRRVEVYGRSRRNP